TTFDGHDERLARVEGPAQARDERADPFAVGAEVPHSAAHGPGRPLQRQRDLEARERAPQAPQPVDRGLAGPAQSTDTRTRGDPLVAHLVLQQVEQLIARVGQPADAERYGSRGDPLGGARPEEVRLLASPRRPTAARGRAGARAP